MSDLMAFAMFFLGMSIGSLSPFGIWGFIGFITMATIFFILELIEERMEARKK